jgi:hypothetical protein
MNMLPRGTEKNGGQGSANILLAFCLFLFRKVTASFKTGTLSPETYTRGKEKLGPMFVLIDIYNARQMS